MISVSPSCVEFTGEARLTFSSCRPFSTSSMSMLSSASARILDGILDVVGQIDMCDRTEIALEEKKEPEATRQKGSARSQERNSSVEWAELHSQHATTGRLLVRKTN